MIALFFALAAHAATFAHLASVDELTARSAAVVRGTVVATETRQVGADLETTYTVAVDETLRGAVPGAAAGSADTVSVTLPGGRLGSSVERFTGVPLWREGDEVVVFVPSAGRPGLQDVVTVHDHLLVDPERVGPVLPETVDELADVVRKLKLEPVPPAP